MDRSEQARPHSYAPIKESEYRQRLREYENQNKGGILNMVLTHPSVDVKFLAQLLCEGCMTRCGLDRGIELYQSCITIHNTTLNEMEYELDQDSHVVMPRKDKARDLRMRDYHLLNLLACAGYGVFFIQQVGFGNDLVEPFIEMLRAVMEHDLRRMRIVYLTSENLTDSLERDQFQQFREAYDLGDTVVKVEDLQKDPIEFLLKLRPQHYPNQDIVNQMVFGK